MDPEIPEDESRRKRVKVSDDQPAIDTGNIDEQALKEAEVGITNFVSADAPGFSGLVKKRYTDFLVNEVLPTGTVLHLLDLSVPPSLKDNAQSGKKADETQKSRPEDTVSETPQQQNGGDSSKKGADLAAAFTLSDDDKQLLAEYIGADVTENVVALHRRALSMGKSKPSDIGKVKSSPITDRDARTKLHQATRRIFSSLLETTTEDDGGILFSAAPQRRGGGPGKNTREGRKGKVGWDDLGGEYLHFTIHKENRDTMEVISFLARQMRLTSKNFQFAGTKDRRGVTVQRASVYRVSVDRLIGAGKALRNAALGDFEYKKQGLELGNLDGNEFVITLRDCEFPWEAMEGMEAPDRVSKASEIISKSLRDLYERGYFNYYGLQRFGTFETRTDMIGVKMLQGDFRGACDLILHVSPSILAAAQITAESEPNVRIGSEEKARAEAIHIFQTTGKVNEALNKLPRKFSAEMTLIKQLGRSKNDYLGALQAIPRNLRLMYVHAYQSLVWNFAVGERWRLYGDKVVAGDLVLANEHKGASQSQTAAADQVDADGEAIILPDAGDSASSADDVFLRARALSAEEAASGTFSVFDVVLPLPGYDVTYPPNEMTDFYKRFMASEQGGGLDPFDMRRKWKDASLSGSYRKILSRPGADFSFEVKSYREDDEQFVTTDLERLHGAVKDETLANTSSSSETPEKLAVVVRFQLGASQYATIALRELTKNGARQYKPDSVPRKS